MYLDTTPLQKNALVVHMYIGMYMLIYVPTCTGVPKVLLISALSFVKYVSICTSAESLYYDEEKI